MLSLNQCACVCGGSCACVFGFLVCVALTYVKSPCQVDVGTVHDTNPETNLNVICLDELFLTCAASN